MTMTIHTASQVFNTMQMGALCNCPSLEEHKFDMDNVRERLAEMRQRNKDLSLGRMQMEHKIIDHNDNHFNLKNQIQDLKDRAKFVGVASNKNPGPIAQYAPNLTCGMDPHEMYVASTDKVKAKAFGMLHREAAQEAASSGTAAPLKKEPIQPLLHKPLPANFSPHQGETLTSVGRQADWVKLGLRSTIHWTATRRPVNEGPILPSLNPPEGEWRAQRHTACYLSRLGKPDMSRSRMHVARMQGRSSSSPSL